MVEKVVVMNCHVQKKVKVGKTVCDEASVTKCDEAKLKSHSHRVRLRPSTREDARRRT